MKVLGYLIIFLFMMMTAVGSYQIITRYFFNRPSTVSEELLTYSFTWMSLLASAYVFGKRDHMRMGFMADKLTGNFRKYLEIIIDLLSFSFAVESMVKNLDDVAGIRIICSFVDDIYEVAEMLVRQDDVTVIAIKDYIKNPKPNGYRSYHMIIEIPVFFSDSKKPIRVEVQIRTIAMDFWASLDHQLKYKKSFVDLNGEISGELKQCADVIAQTDNKMLEIRKRIEAQGVTVSRD